MVTLDYSRNERFVELTPANIFSLHGIPFCDSKLAISVFWLYWSENTGGKILGN